MSDLFDKSIRTLELPRVLELLSEQAVSAEAKQRALRRPAGDGAGGGAAPAGPDGRGPKSSSACGAVRRFPA